MDAARRALIAIAVVVIGCVVVGFLCQGTYSHEMVVAVPLSTANGPIDRVFNHYDNVRLVSCRTPVCSDSLGAIYMLGSKGDRALVLMIHPGQGIIRHFPLRLQDGCYVGDGIENKVFCRSLAVSASGNRIWTATIDWWKHKVARSRITMHAADGKPLRDWDADGTGDYLVAAGEGGAYSLGSQGKLLFLSSTSATPQILRMPFTFPFFDGRVFWSIGPLGSVSSQIGRPEKRGNWLGVANWAPAAQAKLISRFRPPRVILPRIHWIDKRGSYYVATTNDKKTGVGYLLRISPAGQLLTNIWIPSAVPAGKGERLEYGQLIMVDDHGSPYLEVERIRPAREYRIVRIVKKPRWRVWWPSLLPGRRGS